MTRDAIPSAACLLSASRLLLVVLISACAVPLFYPAPTRAELRTLTATGAHRMDERETKADAIRSATEQAKQQALEQVASYLESVTTVRNMDVTRDEIRSYTAGLVVVLDQRVRTLLDGNEIVMRVDLTAQVETEEVARAIATLRDQQDAREQLLALHHDVEQLQQDLTAANHALAAATSPEQVRRANQARTDLLDRTESNAMVAQAWTDWALSAPFMQPYPAAGLIHLQGLLALAGRLDPNNPHLALAQQRVGAPIPKAPPTPPQPPRGPIPHTVPYLPAQHEPPNAATPDNGRKRMMPTYRRIPPPNGEAAPPTLHTYRAGGASRTTPPADAPAPPLRPEPNLAPGRIGP